MRLGWLSILLLLSTPPAAGADRSADAGAPPELSADWLESQHAVIGEVYIENANIFDTDIPGEDRALYRLANKLHIRTRPEVISRVLLFKPGDPFDRRLIEESERLLRSNSYLHDAVIEPVRYRDGTVDLKVTTRDVWTLDPRLSIGRAGGVNSVTVGIKDANLLGRGVYVALYYKSNVDRDSLLLKFADRELGESRYAFSGSIADNSDGKRLDLDFGLPFYALQSRRANRAALLIDDRNDSLYDRGEVRAKFRHQQDQYHLSAGLSRGLQNGWVRRWRAGIQYDEDRFAPLTGEEFPVQVMPEDRRFVYPFVGLELLEDRFEEARNHDQIGQTEDRYLGTRLDLRLGYAAEAFGSLDNAIMMGFDFTTGVGSSESDSLIAGASYNGRLQQGSLRNALLDMGAVFHHRHSRRFLFHAAVSGKIGRNLDLDNQVLLGGDSGLRGYPLRYQGGDSSALLTLEERVFTDWYPFRLFYVGGAVFFDAGRTWGENPVGRENLGWLRDVGFGLRFGNSRSGIGHVLHLDFAFPLDGGDDIDSIQILFKGRTSF